MRLNRSSRETCLIQTGGIAQPTACQFLLLKGSLCPFRDEPPLLLGQRGEEMQHERIGIPPQLCNDEWHSLRYQTGHEGHVARKSVQLRDDDIAFSRAGGGPGRQRAEAGDRGSAVANSS